MHKFRHHDDEQNIVTERHCVIYWSWVVLEYRWRCQTMRAIQWLDK